MTPEETAREIRARYFEAYPFASPAQQAFLEEVVIGVLRLPETRLAAGVFARFPCVGDPAFVDLELGWVEEKAALFQGLDVPHQLLRAKAWLEAAPANRKTAKGLRRFLLSWLGRAHDQAGRRGPPSPGGPGSRESRAQMAARVLGGAR